MSSIALHSCNHCHCYFHYCLSDFISTSAILTVFIRLLIVLIVVDYQLIIAIVVAITTRAHERLFI